MKFPGGVGVALVTPFSDDLSVDFASLEVLVEYLIRAKVDYLVTLGTTGEPSTMTELEKLAVLQFTMEKVNGRLPVVVGLGGNDTAQLVNQAKSWPLASAAAVLCVTPYYNRPSQEGLFRHYATIAESSPKPIILYNVPGRTGCNITAETTIRLAQSFPNIIATKEASGNMIQCMHLAKNRPEGFGLLSGDDHLTLPLVALGFDGVISVAANCFAEFTQLVHMALAGNYAEAQAFQVRLLDALDLMFAENNPAGIKAFLAERGLIKNSLRLPLVPLSHGLHQKVKAYLG
jgi:4-hydroxy-tetrahydrodipicolinate synthase